MSRRAQQISSAGETRGMTLIELMVSMTIMLVAVAAAVAVLSNGVRLANNNQLIIESNDASRMALEYMARLVRNAGVGAGGGVYVWTGAGPQLVPPVFGTDGTGPYPPGPPTVSDELWVVVPFAGTSSNLSPVLNPMTGQELVCTDGAPLPGVTQGGFASGGLRASCTSIFTASAHPPPDAPPAQLLVVNPTTSQGALITNFNVTPESLPGTAGTISGYPGQGTLSNSQQGFHIGDIVYPVQVMHFYVGQAPPGSTYCDAAMNICAPVLYVANAVPNTGGGFPFVDAAAPAAPRVVAPYIENLQVAYFVDPGLTSDPSQYLVSNTYPAGGFTGAAPCPPCTVTGPLSLRSVRLTVVSRTGPSAVLSSDMTEAAIIASTGNTSPCNTTGLGFSNITPLIVENTFCESGYFGYRRSAYGRRVEIPNMLPGNL